MFAIMASLMNLALSASELFSRHLNTAFQVAQQNYSNLGLLMITVGAIGLVPLFALPLLRREEALTAENQVNGEARKLDSVSIGDLQS